MNAQQALAPTGKLRVSVPFGPLIVTDKPEILTSTPEGTTTASFPIRDMSCFFPLSFFRLPNEAHDFATNVALARFAVGHEPLACGQNCYTQTAEHARYVGGCAIHAQTWSRYALDT